MTPDAQRIAIAEAVGWKRFPRADDTQFDPPRWVSPDGEMTHTLVSMPNYLNDLNAIAAAEQYAGENIMDADEWEEYGKQLERIHDNALAYHPKDRTVDYYGLASLITGLSAAQRCEAFLKTMGLWQPQPAS